MTDWKEWSTAKPAFPENNSFLERENDSRRVVEINPEPTEFDADLPPEARRNGFPTTLDDAWRVIAQLRERIINLENRVL